MSTGSFVFQVVYAMVMSTEDSSTLLLSLIMIVNGPINDSSKNAPPRRENQPAS
jgi:hypothetical protein